jgi:hypothetical protein
MGQDPRNSNAASDEAEMQSNAEIAPDRPAAGQEHADAIESHPQRAAGEPSGTTETTDTASSSGE